MVHLVKSFLLIQGKESNLSLSVVRILYYVSDQEYVVIYCSARDGV